MESGAASPYTSEPVCVLPNLYLGAEHNATDLRTLQRLGITFVLNVAIEIAQEDSSLAAIASSKTDDAVTVRGGVHYKSLAWTHHQKNLLRDFPVAFALIDEALAHNSGSGKALVHCQLGVSRSASLVIAYVMRSLNMGLTEAYDFVKQRSGVISPNMSLMYQLAEYEKSLKNPTSAAAALASTDSCSTSSSSEQKRSSWSSQIDDDEPPYPFSAAFSAAAATSDSTASVAPVTRRATISFLLEDASMASVPSTPIRQEFHKRPLTPENGFEDHPNTKPFQSPSRLTLPKSSFLASRRTSRSGGYQRSPLTSFSAKSLDSQSRTPTQASYPPKTPTTERFSSLTLEVPSSFDDVEMMVPPTPLFQSSFTIPSLSSSSSSSSASSVSSFEACSRPSVSSSESMASLAYSAACDNEQVYSSSAPVELCSPRNSGAWSLLPSTRMASSAEVTVVVDHEKSLQSIASSSSSLPSSLSEPKLKQPESKKKQANALWSGLNALKVVAGVSAVTSSTGRSIVVATAATAVMATTTSASSEAIAVSTTTEATTDFTTATSSATVAGGGAGAAKISSGANKLPDFIFSPRPYTPTHHETRSFGDFYQALCMES
ncbi:Dual specificity protein phosphatase 9 [Dissophora globulifera]|uniref:protein-tyrosine-phosphatase n=1 Tax=Dissophora globulifera TaxID=979702 RepID=A0A9P6RA12_9FUNG|nr:Dual specificity protein phosphatase 9 [Dissophora globulifera]